MDRGHVQQRGTSLVHKKKTDGPTQQQQQSCGRDKELSCLSSPVSLPRLTPRGALTSDQEAVTVSHVRFCLRSVPGSED